MKNRNVSHSFGKNHMVPGKRNIILPNSPSLPIIKLTAGSILKSQSNNPSPTLKFYKDRPYPKKNSHVKLAYTNLEIFYANQGPRDKIMSQNLKNLRSNFKNPYIFVNGTDVNSNQKNIENRLFRIYSKILRD